jgi:serine/threonine-protein kinase
VADELDDDEEPAVSLPAGTLIGGKYRVERLIGRGGMGSVWAATHVSLGQRVAVKLIARRFANSRDARQRFDTEAKAAAQLRSRYVVQVYDNGVTDNGVPYIVMEHLEGESLDARVARLGRLSLPDTARILNQVGRALGRAHSVGVVHRDLKPENIFLATSQDDEGEVAKVLDFGIAKIRRDEEIGSSTKTGAILGTPLYMSPEQARGLKSLDYRTDLYSLGMVAFAMLTGDAAFTGESIGDLLVAICTLPFPSVRARVPTLPWSLDGWFERACHRVPEERFQSAVDLVDTFHLASGLGPRGSRDSGSGIVAAPEPPVAPAPAPVQVVAPAPAVLAQTGREPTIQTGGITTSPFSVTGVSIPKRSLAVPTAIVVGVVAVGIGLFALSRSHSDDSPAAANASSPVPAQAAATNTGTPAPTASVEPAAATNTPPAAEPAVVRPAAPTPGAAARVETEAHRVRVATHEPSAPQKTPVPAKAAVHEAAAASPPAKPATKNIDLGF